MHDPTQVGPLPAPLTGGGTEPYAHQPEELQPRPESLRHKILTRGAAVGAALTSPILTDRARAAYHDATDGILRARQNPERMIGERDVMASLDVFLDRKARTVKVAMGAPGQSWGGAIAEGLAKGTGSELGKALVHGAGRLMGGAHSSLVLDPQKKAILDRVLSSDMILSDSIKHSPGMAENLLEAYKTLNKFAPTLATDTNAVRSFLREVVLGGGHVNYATIKNLVDTEKAIHADKPMYGGVF